MEIIVKNLPYFILKFIRNVHVQKKSILVFVSIFIYLYTILVGNINSKEVGLSIQVPISASNELLKNSISSSVADEALYLHTAFDLADGRPIDDLSKFALRQWAPGMSFTLASFLIVFPSISLGVLWLFLLLSIWALVFTLAIGYGKTILAKSLIFTLFTLLLQTDIFQNWIFSSGFYYSEGISIEFLSLFVIYLNRNRKFNIRSIVFSSLTLFFALLFKGAVEYVVYLLIILSLLSLIILRIKKNSINPVNNKLNVESNIANTKNINLILISSLVCFMLTIPWRIVSDTYLYPSENFFGWTNNSSIYWGHRWMHPDWLKERKIEWFIKGGGNSACLVDVDLCNKIYKLEVIETGGDYSGTGFFSQSEFRRMAMQTYLTHPIKTATNRLEPLIQHWFIPNDRINFNNIFSTILVMSAILMAIAMSMKLKLYGGKIVVFISILGGTLGPLLLQSIENRYLYLIKITIVLYMLNFIGNIGSKRGVAND